MTIHRRSSSPTVFIDTFILPFFSENKRRKKKKIQLILGKKPEAILRLDSKRADKVSWRKCKVRRNFHV